MSATYKYLTHHGPGPEPGAGADPPAAGIDSGPAPARRERKLLIILGFKTRAALLATVSLACRDGHVAAHRIVKVTRWFTLFFIPLIPFSSKHRSVCIQCGLTLDIPKQAAEELARGQGGQAVNPADFPPSNQ